MGSQRTPRHSSRLREKSQRTFRMPSRDDILDSIEVSPHENLHRLKPRKIINNFTKEHNSYNNRSDLPELSEEDESFSDFLDDTPTKTNSKRRKKVKEKSPKKRRRRLRALDSDSDSEDETLQNPRRQSTRIKKQPKREFQKPDKKVVLNKIIESEPNMREVIDSDDAEDFVKDTESEDGMTSDEEGRVSPDVATPDDEGATRGRDESGDGVTAEGDGRSSDHRYQSVSLGNPGNERSHSEEQHYRSSSSSIEEGKVKNKSIERDDSSDNDESEIRIGNCLRSKVHRKSQLCKALDSGDSSGSDNEVNASFAKREQKRKINCLNSDEEDSDES